MSDEAIEGRQNEPARGLVRAWPRLDPILYVFFAAVCVLYAAGKFYGAMHDQTRGVWSAPLDDVFIHFDYARATARGFPFQWSEGNGFSSGNTSLTYPFTLAFGYWFGFRGPYLMEWAALVAAVSVFGFLLAAARPFEVVGRWAKYLLPPVVLSLGALNWSLWSGMENAFHLGVWALAFVAASSIERAAAGPDAPKQAARRAWITGLAGALLFWTRPESVVVVAALAVHAAVGARDKIGAKRAFWLIPRVGLPGGVALVIQAVANRVFTGEWAANGAIAKLALNNPYMTPQAKWDEYLFHLKYVVLRNTQHHFAEALPGQIPWGWLVLIVAIAPVFSRETRRIALVLWAHVIGWSLLVAMNGQVRWQNERYTMAAVAWLLVLAALAMAVILKRTYTRAASVFGGEGAHRARIELGIRLAVATTIGLVYWVHQLPNFRDQVWFFARASRNIHDQHILAGEILRQLRPRRVLVGDAGALLYASDRPGLDLIGLGGYHDLPFARAGVHGLGASLELIERMRPEDRPDMMAIYPSWWGDLPVLFGKKITEVPVYGNVICGGAEKVLYKATWDALDHEGKPRSLRDNERVTDELDVADLISEKEHQYVFPHPDMGFVTFRVLPDLADPRRDLFDAGREIPGGQSERARMKMPSNGGRLIVRTASTHGAKIDVRIAGKSVGTLSLDERHKADPRHDPPIPATDRGWSELAIDLPPGLPPTVELELASIDGWADHHVWIVAPR